MTERSKVPLSEALKGHRVRRCKGFMQTSSDPLAVRPWRKKGANQ